MRGPLHTDQTSSLGWMRGCTLGKPHLSRGMKGPLHIGKPPLSYKLHPERVKGSLHTGWTLSFRPSYGLGAHCTLPAKLHLQEGWGLAAYWLNPYLSEGMRGPLHTRHTSSVRRDEGPTADWLNLILRIDAGLVAHWVNLIFQGKLGMRGPLHTG